MSLTRLALLLSISIVVAACDSGSSDLMDRLTDELPPESSADSTVEGEGLGGSPLESVEAAADRYVRAETDVEEFSVQVEAVAEGWARVRVLPEGNATDPALLFLRRDEAGGWRGVAIGTAFAPFDLDELGVPAAVRPEE